jgi:hypothetical protein
MEDGYDTLIEDIYMKTSERGEVATILAISAIVVIGISMISSAFFGGKKQTTSSKAEDVCTLYDNLSCDDISCSGKCSQSVIGARCCIPVAQTAVPTQSPTGTSTPPVNQPTTPPSTPADSICPNGNQACASNCGSGNDCVKYLESVTVPGLSDGAVINTDTFSCDIVTKNVNGVRTDTDNICGVKVNGQWPAWCPWDGVGQYMCGATITSRANCDLKSSHFNSTPVKVGDTLQVVAARKTGSCGNIPWNTAGSFITGPTFYYKQKGAGNTNTTPQATTAPQTPRATSAPQQPQPTAAPQNKITTAPTSTAGACIEYSRTNVCMAECSLGYPGWSCKGTKCCPPGANPTQTAPTAVVPTGTATPTGAATSPTPVPSTQTPSPFTATSIPSNTPSSSPQPTVSSTPTISLAEVNFDKKGTITIEIKLLNMDDRKIEEELKYFSCQIFRKDEIMSICELEKISADLISAKVSDMVRFNQEKYAVSYDIFVIYKGRTSVTQQNLIIERKISFLGDEYNKSFAGQIDYHNIKKNYIISIKNSKCNYLLVIPKKSVTINPFSFKYPEKDIEIKMGDTVEVARGGVDTSDGLSISITGGVCMTTSGRDVKDVNGTFLSSYNLTNNYAFLIDVK